VVFDWHGCEGCQFGLRVAPGEAVRRGAAIVTATVGRKSLSQKVPLSLRESVGVRAGRDAVPRVRHLEPIPKGPPLPPNGRGGDYGMGSKCVTTHQP